MAHDYETIRALNTAIARLTYHSMALRRAKAAGEFSAASYLAFLCFHSEHGEDALALDLCVEARKLLEG